MAQFPWNPWDKQKDRFPTKPTGFEEELRKLENEFANALQEGGSFSYGYSIVSVNGQPIRQEIYAPHRTGAEGGQPAQSSIAGQAITEAEEREPLVDVIEEKDATKVLVELPGIEKEDIKLTADENTLEVRVDTPSRKYRKTIELSHPAANPKAEYRNGVLEVSIQKTEPENINIE